MRSAVPFVGLTGGLGAGKSTALAALGLLGAEVLSSDAVVHELYEGAELRDAVLARFGPEVAPEGVVDRSAVARHAFASAEDTAWLEATVWPLVGVYVAAWLERVRAREPAPRAAVVEVPLLFEAGLERLYDATIAVISEEELRRTRAAHGATSWSTSAPRASSPRRRRRGGRRSWCATMAPWRTSSETCRPSLAS